MIGVKNAWEHLTGTPGNWALPEISIGVEYPEEIGVPAEDSDLPW